MIEGLVHLHAAGILVEKVHHRDPILLRKGVCVVRIVNAEIVLRAQEFIDLLRGLDGMFDCVGQGNGVCITFQRNERPGGGKSQEPMLVKRELFPLSPKLVQVRREPIGIFFLHDVQGFTLAGAGETIGADAAAAGHNRRAQEPRVKRRCNHRGFSIARGTGDDDFCIINCGIGCKIINDA